ncbi:hypothetical protein H0H92_011538 [Tricholoma furcatifolium]|nr:hypothetical protein H0H92_011538 [Tricholoma furcatifolium]
MQASAPTGMEKMPVVEELYHVQEMYKDFDFVDLLKAAVEEEGCHESVDQDGPEDFLLSITGKQPPPQVESVPLPVNSNGKHDREDTGWQARKKRKRKERSMRNVYDLGGLPTSTSLRHLSEINAHDLSTFDIEDVKPAEPGYVGMRTPADLRRENWTDAELQEAGFEFMEWPDRPCVITDKSHRIICVLIGRPKHSSWDKVIQNAALLLNNFREKALKAGFLSHKDHQDNRRGNFYALAAGVSMGGGRMAPGEFVHPPGLQVMLDELLAEKDIQRIANFQSKALFSYAPKLYGWLCTKIGDLMKTFKRYFPKSVFPAITINLGPQTQCLIHRDPNNLANGLCIVTALGNYDHKRGGKFVFPQLKLVIEFPAGMSLALPSATLLHGNTPIQSGELRFSITQYCAGGLVRWVDYGCTTAKRLCSTAGGRSRRAEMDGPPGSRWKQVINLFSRFNELENDRRNVLERAQGTGVTKGMVPSTS